MRPLDDEAAEVDEDASPRTGVRLDALPNELLIHIFSLLDCESVRACGSVCARWAALALAPPVWRRVRVVLCMKNYAQLRDGLLPRVAAGVRSVKLQYFKLYGEVRATLTACCPNLTHLEISISQVDASVFDDLRCWPRLRLLSFRNSLITSRRVAAAAGAGEGGESVEEEEERAYTFEVPFAHLERLETLVLSNFGLTQSSLDDLLRCRHLSSLNIEKMKNVPSRFIESFIADRPHSLRSLCVNGDTLTDAAMRALSRCARLEVLHVTTCKGLFDSTLAHLARVPALRSLRLRHGYFSQRALLAYFSDERIFARMTYLSLSRCMHVDMRVAEKISANAPRLRELSLYQCPFVMDEGFDRGELRRLFDVSLLLD